MKNFSFSIDIQYADATVRCVIGQYILREGGAADGQKIGKLVIAVVWLVVTVVGLVLLIA